MSIILPPLELSEAQRATLAEWQAELGKLVAQQRACKARSVHGSLGVHLASAIRGAHATIATVCEIAQGKLISTAARTVSPYFDRAGDARQAAKQFPAFAELAAFLRGGVPDNSLRGLADRAEAVAELIGRILAGAEVWRFKGGEDDGK